MGDISRTNLRRKYWELTVYDQNYLQMYNLLQSENWISHVNGKEGDYSHTFYLTLLHSKAGTFLRRRMYYPHSLRMLDQKEYHNLLNQLYQPIHRPEGYLPYPPIQQKEDYQFDISKNNTQEDYQFDTTN